MANENDSAIAERIIELPTPLRLHYFWKVCRKIRDDSTYWQLLGTLWIDAEILAPNYGYWIELFRADRRNRHKLMKKGDRAIWRKLPAVMTVYRATYPGDDLTRAMSWTLDRSVCGRFFPGREIVSRQVTKEDVLAYFDRRREKEVVILPRRNE